MTNGDRIRAMTDAELADTMRDSICALVPNEVCLCGKLDCDECIRSWLKQEVDNGNP